MGGDWASSRERDLVTARLRPPPRTLFAVGPVTATVAALAFTLLAAWAGGATWYIASKEDLVGELLRRQAQTEARYEDQVGALRARLDRVASQKLIDQDTIEQRVGALVNRQAELETRQAVLADLAERIAPGGALVVGDLLPAATGSLRASEIEAPALPAAATGFAPVPRPAPVAPDARERRPEPGGFELRLRDGRASDASRVLAPASSGAAPVRAALEGGLTRVEAALAGIEERQMRALAAIQEVVEDEASLLREAILTAGLDPDSLEPAPEGVLAVEGMGGPFIPLGIDGEAGGFEAKIDGLQEMLILRDRLRRTTIGLPFARPVSGEVAVTSDFGVRPDPFTRRPAFHGGIDFRAATGTPVYATAAGRVVVAARAGGYGNLVEIDHGNGLTTRFAHLSAIVVAEGDEVAAGTIVGRAGSTGRSTGPHLHYETRIDGRPVDPRRFLRAGELLDAGG